MIREIERLRGATSPRARYDAALEVLRAARRSPWRGGEHTAELVREMAKGGALRVPAHTEWIAHPGGGEHVPIPARDEPVARWLEDAIRLLRDANGNGEVERALVACCDDAALEPLARRLLDELRARPEPRRHGSVAPPLYVRLSIPTRLDGEDVVVPIRVVIFGDFLGRTDPTPLPARPQMSVDGFLDRVLAEQDLSLELSVPDLLSGANTLALRLRFTALSDFDPAQLAAQVPSIARALEAAEALEEEARGAAHRRIAAQLDAILHHPAFQALESAWRTLHFLVDRADPAAPVKVFAVHATKAELAQADGDTLREVLAPSGYLSEHFLLRGGGAPLALAVGLYEVGPVDLDLLARCAAVGASLMAPFLTDASPTFWGVDSFAQLADPAAFAERLRRAEPADWAAFRDREEARFAALCAPRVLLREPHVGVTRGSLVYCETIAAHHDYLWGSPAAALASVVLRSVARYGHGANMIGPRSDAGGLLEGLPRRRVAPAGAPSRALSTEAPLSERAEYALWEAGFIGAVGRADEGTLTFYSAGSCRRTRPPAKDAQLERELPYTLFIARVASCLELLHRSTFRKGDSAAIVFRRLDAWLQGTVVRFDLPAAAERPRRLLRWAELELGPPQAGGIPARLRVRPCFKYMGADFTLSIDLFLRT